MIMGVIIEELEIYKNFTDKVEKCLDSSLLQKFTVLIYTIVMEDITDKVVMCQSDSEMVCYGVYITMLRRF